MDRSQLVAVAEGAPRPLGVARLAMRRLLSPLSSGPTQLFSQSRRVLQFNVWGQRKPRTDRKRTPHPLGSPKLLLTRALGLVLSTIVRAVWLQ